MTLARYLQESGLSVREFASRIGVSPEAIRLYLKGQRRPRGAVIKAIASETKGAVSANDFYAAEATP